MKLFPPDFFDPILPGQESNQKNKIDKEKKEDKRIVVDLLKEEEEDKQLLELLEGKRKKYIIIELL